MPKRTLPGCCAGGRSDEVRSRGRSPHLEGAGGSVDWGVWGAEAGSCAAKRSQVPRGARDFCELVAQQVQWSRANLCADAARSIEATFRIALASTYPTPYSQIL